MCHRLAGEKVLNQVLTGTVMLFESVAVDTCAALIELPLTTEIKLTWVRVNIV